VIRQILVSIAVLILAGAAYVYFVPGGDGLLHRIGISAPIPTAYAVADPGVAGAAPAGGQGKPAGQGGAQAGGGGGGAGGFQRQTPTVITASVTTSHINDRLTAVGQGSAIQSVSVTSQATGTLVKLDVKPGDKVNAGQVIAELDSDAEHIAFDKATLAANDAGNTLARTQTLAKSNNATTVQLSTAQLAVDNATLELRNAKLALDKRSIVTPIDGSVGLFQVTAGNAVGAQTIVTTIDDTSSILVNFWVPERLAPVLKSGQPVSAVATALPEQTFDGTVTAVDSRIDATSRTLQVQASIPNPAGAITAGMSFEVSMAFPGEVYPAVDPLAIQWAADGSYVWLLTPDSKVKKNKVAIIQRNSDGVLVKGDLQPGAQVVTQGVLQLADGATVRQLDAGNAGTAGKPTADSTVKPVGGGKPHANGTAAPAPAPAKS
jgi:RND family efflux transporter MFP subunit